MRHGRRPYTIGDVPLNEEGLNQAFELTKDLKILGAKTLLSSPKKRAQMTLEPLSKHLNIPIEVVDLLDQHHSKEDERSFRARVQKIIDSLSEEKWPSPVLLCSHSDWLSLATQLIPTDELDLDLHMFQCAEYLGFEIVDGIWKLKKD